MERGAEGWQPSLVIWHAEEDTSVCLGQQLQIQPCSKHEDIGEFPRHEVTFVSDDLKTDLGTLNFYPPQGFLSQHFSWKIAVHRLNNFFDSLRSLHAPTQSTAL